MNTKEKDYLISSNRLINRLISSGEIEYIGKGNRYNDNSGLNNDKFKSDNTYNWEIMQEDEDNMTNLYYSLSNNFELKETDDILVLSKHVGVDIREGYEDDIIFIKNNNMQTFYGMIYENLDLAIESEV